MTTLVSDSYQAVQETTQRFAFPEMESQNIAVYVSRHRQHEDEMDIEDQLSSLERMFED